LPAMLKNAYSKMKTGLIFLLSGLFLLTIFLLLTQATIFESSIDIHLYDAYYVIDMTAVLLFTGLFLLTLFFLGYTVATKFKKQIYLFTLFVLVAVDIYYVIRLTNPNSEPVKNEKEETQTTKVKVTSQA
jgi:hypothetical protein